LNNHILRRDLLAGTGAALTTSLFAGKAQGAGERIAVGFIGLGAMGSGNLEFAIRAGAQAVAVCDVYQPHLDRAVATATKAGHQVKAYKDFRELLADKSIDAVCISTPDHWHAYMTVEACKAGKDVYVEKPASVYVEEGQKMVQAARKYKRIVQAGTMQRSGGYFKKAREIVKSGILGDVTFCHAFQSGSTSKKGFGTPPVGTPVPTDLDWEMWLGPAPKVAFDLNRWGVKDKAHPDYGAGFPTFRYFWDYAGGAMTDWGVHLIDPLHQMFDEVMPTMVAAMGEKFYVEDNRETPDTMLATFHYPKFLASYESRTANPLPMFGLGFGAGTTVHGTEATLFVNRGHCYVIPASDKQKALEVKYENDAEMNQMNVPHWKNWIECIKTRNKPQSEIETCVRSSTVCLLANLALRHKKQLDWDEANWTVKQDDVKPFLKAKYRAPWKLVV